MDRGKVHPKKRLGQKLNLPSGSYVALGKTGGTSNTTTPLHEDASGSTKHDSLFVPPKKKPKLDEPLAAVVSFQTDVDSSWSEFCGPTNSIQRSSLLRRIRSATTGTGNVSAELNEIICTILKLWHENRTACPDIICAAAFAIAAKENPAQFRKFPIFDGICSLLQRSSNLKLGSRPHIHLVELVTNALFCAFSQEHEWKMTLIKVFLDDSLNDRFWVDAPACQTLCRNIATAFDTRPLPLDLQFGSAGSEPSFLSSINQFEGASSADNNLINIDLPAHCFALEDKDTVLLVSNRFEANKTTTQTMTVGILREQWTKRSENPSKSLLQTLSVCAGLKEVRLAAAQRLETWMANPRLQRCAIHLLASICQNCDCQRFGSDTEVASCLVKLKLKSKLVSGAFNTPLKLFLSNSPDNLYVLLVATIQNELSPNRGQHNMQIIAQCFQHNASQSAYALASSIQNCLLQKEDMLRSIRGLLREVVKTALRYEFPLQLFIEQLLRERAEIQHSDLSIKTRAFHALLDVVTVVRFACASPAIREAASGVQKGLIETRNTPVLRQFQHQVALVQQAVVHWLCYSVPKTYKEMVKTSPTEYVKAFYKIMLLEKPDTYTGVDGWPPEQDRNFLLKLCNECPLLEDTLMDLLSAGISNELPITAADVIEIIEQATKRAAFTASPGWLSVTKADIVQLFFSCCRYRIPESLAVFDKSKMPEFGVSTLFWKSCVILLILAAHNPVAIGDVIWNSYPTLKWLMEMVITNDYTFPPASACLASAALSSLKNQEVQLAELGKQQILALESHLAALTTKSVITEANSLLLSQLLILDPTGPARKPPATFLENLKVLNQQLSFGMLMCRSRRPDFLLDIIQRQSSGRSSLSWLMSLIESNEDYVNILPLECICEFARASIAEKMASDERSPEKQSASVEAKGKGNLELLEKLKLICWRPESGVDSVRQVLRFFLGLLRLETFEKRNVVVRCLNALASAPENVSFGQKLASSLPTSMHENFGWLFFLLDLPHFEHLADEACAHVKEACAVETSPLVVSAYVHFLALCLKQVKLFGPEKANKISIDVAKILLERRLLLIRVIGEQAQQRLDWQSSVFRLLLEMFASYAEKHMKKQQEIILKQEPIQLDSLEPEQVYLRWPRNSAEAIFHESIVTAMLFLMTFESNEGPREKTTMIYDELLQVWQSEGGAVCQVAVNQAGKSGNVFKEWIISRALCTDNQALIKAALKNCTPDITDPSSLLSNTFGVSQMAVNEILNAFNSDIIVEPSTSSQGSSGFTPKSLLLNRQLKAHLESGLIKEQNHGKVASVLLTSKEADIQKRLASKLKLSANILQMNLRKQGEENAMETEKLSSDKIFDAAAVELGGRESLFSHNPKFRCYKNRRREKPVGTKQRELQVQKILSQQEKLKETLLECVTDKSRVSDGDLSLTLETFFLLDAETMLCSDKHLELMFGTEFTSCSYYLLAKMLHSAKLSTLKSILNKLLTNFKPGLCPTLVLDFVDVCLNHPALRVQCQHPEQVPTRFLCFSPEQLGVLSRYVVLESAQQSTGRSSNNSPPQKEDTPARNSMGSFQDGASFSTQNISTMRARLSLLLDLNQSLSVDHGVDSTVDATVSMLLLGTHNKHQEIPDYPKPVPEQQLSEDVSKALVDLMYLQKPELCTSIVSSNVAAMATKTGLGAHSRVLQKSFSRFDAVLNMMFKHLLKLAERCDLSAEEQLDEVFMSLRALAMCYGPLVCRSLGSLSIQLRPIPGYSMTKLRNTSFLKLLPSVLELVDLLQPIIFEDNCCADFIDLMQCYLQFTENHALRNPRFVNLIEKSLILLKNFHCANPEKASKFLEGCGALIQAISSRYPELPSLRDLLSQVTLPLPPITPQASGDIKPAATGREYFDRDPGHFMPSSGPTPTLLNELGGTIIRMKRDNDYDVVLALEELKDLLAKNSDVLEFGRPNVIPLLMRLSKNYCGLALELLLSFCTLRPSNINDFTVTCLNSLAQNGGVNSETGKTGFRLLKSCIVMATREQRIELLRRAFNKLLKWCDPQLTAVLVDAALALQDSAALSTV